MSLAVVKQAVLDVLTARPGLAGIPVSADLPRDTTQIQADDGRYESITIGAARADSVEPPVLGTPVWLDEQYTLDLVVQVLKRNEDAGSQLEADTRLDEIRYEVFGAFQNAPDLGIAATSDLQVMWVLPSGWEHTPGWLGADQNGSAMVIQLAVRTRLTLT